MAHFIPLLKLPPAKEIAELVTLHLVQLHGIPADVVSDKGPVHFQLIEGVLCFMGAVGQSVFGVSPPIQKSNREKKRDGNSPAMPNL